MHINLYVLSYMQMQFIVILFLLRLNDMCDIIICDFVPLTDKLNAHTTADNENLRKRKLFQIFYQLW